MSLMSGKFDHDSWRTNFMAKGRNASFMFSFLGYIVNQEGADMVEAKMAAVMEWPIPKMVKNLQCFLGFTNFYRRFIWGFSSIALMTFLKKDPKRLSWNPEADEAFAKHKTAFTTAPILRHLDPSKPFVGRSL